MAIINGANTGLQLTLGICALLVAFLGIVALADLFLKAFNDFRVVLAVAVAITLFRILLGVRKLTGKDVAGGFMVFLGLVIAFAVLVGLRLVFRKYDLELSLRSILGLAGYPFALVIGVPPGDAAVVGKLIGQRAILTEVVSYKDLAAHIKAGDLASPRSQVIAAYALCGFAHIASLAIFVGGTAVLTPKRAPDLARVSLRALLAATLACLMTGAVAGTFFTSKSLLLGGR
jgi:CNT family concentrative nucleoside transporter